MPDLLHSFYPIVPDIEWLNRIVPLGVKTVQLRMKHTSLPEVKQQIQQAISLCARHDCTLIINDFWREAIELGADFIHLGQEDLAIADLSAIQKAGLRLGVSTHSHEELETALAARPDYVALGPIWESKLKKMKWDPQGLNRLADWAGRSPVPVVAIGGITLERAPRTWRAGAQSIAVVTDIITHTDPEQRTKDWLAVTSQLEK